MYLLLIRIHCWQDTLECTSSFFFVILIINILFCSIVEFIFYRITGPINLKVTFSGLYCSFVCAFVIFNPRGVWNGVCLAELVTWNKYHLFDTFLLFPGLDSFLSNESRGVATYRCSRWINDTGAPELEGPPTP